MTLTAQRAAARGKTKLLAGSLLIAVGFVGGLTLVLDFASWKADGYIANLVFCMALICCGVGLFVADRAGYHLGWMNLLGAMLIVTALMALAAEVEDHLLAASTDSLRGLIQVIAIAYFGALFLHLGHRRHLARAGR
jgi:hypothetical protein